MCDVHLHCGHSAYLSTATNCAAKQTHCVVARGDALTIYMCDVNVFNNLVCLRCLRGSRSRSVANAEFKIHIRSIRSEILLGKTQYTFGKITVKSPLSPIVCISSFRSNSEKQSELSTKMISDVGFVLGKY